MRIRARFSITTPSKATATVTVVGAVKALVSIAKEITAPKAAAAITAGILVASAAYASPKAVYVDSPRIRAEVSFPVQFMDGATPSDTVAISIDKIFLDVTTNGDIIDYFTFVKVLNETVVTSDALTRVHTKPLDFDETDADVDPDPVLATDFPAFDLTRPDVADTATISDVAAKHLTRASQDVATTSDGVDYLVATKVLVDTAVPADVINSFVLVRPDVADTATTSDANAKQVTKPDLTSAAEATDAAALHPQPVYTDTATTADANAKTVTAVLADSVTVTDAADVLLVPVRFFTEDSSTADNLVIAEFTTGVDSRAVNGYAVDESQFN